MATTSIWSVKGWLGRVVIYIENPSKTQSPRYKKLENMSEPATQGLADVIAYATKMEKTSARDREEKSDAGSQKGEDVLQQYVSGVNCSVITARSEMIAVKKRFGKENGIVAYHGYQSFAPGECTPAQAHEIGVKLAKELWGDRFQVLVATHLDKSHHLHNHFVVNTVSFVDGKRYHRTKQDYRNMQKLSDRLCQEYGLSVIENPQTGRTKHYAEWKAEQEDRPTWRGLIQKDVDQCIEKSRTESQFLTEMRRLGYKVKLGKYISVRPQGKERFFRLERNLGESYSRDSIRERILKQAQNDYRAEKQKAARVINGRVHVFVRGNRDSVRGIRGLRAIYYRYLYQMGVFPKDASKKVSFLIKEDIRKLDQIFEEVKLLSGYHIDSIEQLFSFKDLLQQQIAEKTERRNQLRTQKRRKENRESKEISAELSRISDEIAKLRKQCQVCDRVEVRSREMLKKIRYLEESERQKGSQQEKEGLSYGYGRKCSR